LADRFWEKVDKSGECWVWLGATQHRYGAINLGGSTNKVLRAHRLSWEWAYGPVPPGMQVCHRCDNPPCVRPEHLFLGTMADNMADASTKRRFAPRRRLTEQQVLDIRRRHATGETQKALAREYGVWHGQISRIIRGEEWRHLPLSKNWGQTRGERNHSARLTADQARSIRASTERAGVLADHYGVSDPTVNDIRKSRTWRHLM
jgi:hypothetical protein